MVEFGKRSIKRIFSGVSTPQNYVVAARMMKAYKNPLNGFARYLLAKGSYPALVPLNTPSGVIDITAYSFHDLLTINETFCREDCHATAKDKIIVDFGSNIGVTAAYFLSRSRNSYCYLFEPLPTNVDRLRRNLNAFEGRYSLKEAAVGLTPGQVQFGWEETGRYGGIGKTIGRFITVDCVDSNEALSGVLSRHSQIDVLKVDIEGLEEAVVERIHPEIARHIKKIYAEHKFAKNPLPATHLYRQYGSVAQMRNKNA
jgi:FkbM family methyltransferase